MFRHLPPSEEDSESFAYPQRTIGVHFGSRSSVLEKDQLLFFYINFSF